MGTPFAKTDELFKGAETEQTRSQYQNKLCSPLNLFGAKEQKKK